MQKTNNTIHPMSRLLYSYKINGVSLANAIGCCEPTARNKLTNPEKLTIGDLRKIHERLGVPSEELRERVIS